MRFLCAQRPRFFKGSPLLEAAADEVLSGADVSAIGRGGRRVALGSSVHGAPGIARGGRDIQKWPPRAGAGPTGARGRPASCSAPPSPTQASCPAVTSALQAGSGGAGVALGLGGGPPPHVLRARARGFCFLTGHAVSGRPGTLCLAGSLPPLNDTGAL